MTQRLLTLWMLVALVAGNMMGSGVLMLPANLAALGSIGLLGWLGACVGGMLLALTFGELSMVYPRVGGPYAYCTEGFGEFVGFQMAFNYWLALCTGNAAIAVAFAGYLVPFFPALVHWPWMKLGLCLSLVWSLTLLNLIGVQAAGRFQLVMTILKLLPLGLVMVFGLSHFHPSYLSQINQTHESLHHAFTQAVILAFWSFIGVESGTVPAEHVEKPEKNIRRATILGTLLATVVYVLSGLAIFGVIPVHQLMHSSSPFADVLTLVVGPSAGQWVAIGALLACVGTLNGWTLLQGQLPYAIAKDGLFPSWFAKLHPTRHTPVAGLVVASVFISVLMLVTSRLSLIKQFEMIILLATLSSVVTYFASAIAAMRLVPHARWVAGLAALFCFWILCEANRELLAYEALLLLVSFPVYLWCRWTSPSRDPSCPSRESGNLP